MWVKVQVATQRRLKRNLAVPCNPSDPLSPGYCDPTALDNILMVCWTGVEPRIAEAFPLPDPTVCGDPVNPLLIYTSLSIQPGGAVRVVRELAALGKTPSLPGGLVLDGCPVALGGGWPSNTGFTVDGIDSAAAGFDTHAVVTRCLPDLATLQTSIPDGAGKKFCNPAFTPYPGCQSGNNRNVNYPGVGNSNCTAPNCSNTPESADIFHDTTLATDTAFGTCGGLQDLVEYVREAAYAAGEPGVNILPSGTTNITDPGDGSPLNMPDQWDRVINVIEGDATLGQADFGNPGAGIILIEGDLVLNDYPYYNGLILVIGTGNVEISGGGTAVMNGGIIVANTTVRDPITDAPGPVTWDQTGGGTFELHYNSDAINPINGILPVQKLSLNY